MGLLVTFAIGLCANANEARAEELKARADGGEFGLGFMNKYAEVDGVKLCRKRKRAKGRQTLPPIPG